MLEKCKFCVQHYLSQTYSFFSFTWIWIRLHSPNTITKQRHIYANRAMRWLTNYSRNECMQARYNDFRVNSVTQWRLCCTRISPYSPLHYDSMCKCNSVTETSLTSCMGFSLAWASHSFYAWSAKCFRMLQGVLQSPKECFDVLLGVLERPHMPHVRCQSHWGSPAVVFIFLSCFDSQSTTNCPETDLEYFQFQWIE